MKIRQGMCLRYISGIRKFTGIFYLQFTSEIVPLSHAFRVQSHTMLEIFRRKSVLKPERYFIYIEAQEF
jgi:hypothetical protein